MPKATTKYRTPPKTAFRKMGLGVIEDGHIRVVAGFKFAWWSPGGEVIPIIVKARVIRIKSKEVSHA